MVHSLAGYAVLVILAMFPAVDASFSFCANYIFTSAYYSSADVKWNNQISSTNLAETYPGQSDSVVAPTTSCSSTYLNGYDWGIVGYYPTCNNLAEFGLGFWVNFESTAGTNIVIIGSRDGYPYTYLLTWNSDGTIKFTYDDGWGNRPADNAPWIIPLKQWIFIAFHWVGTTFDIYLVGNDVFSKTYGSYKKPSSGEFVFGGSSAQAHIYQVFGFKSASVNGDFSIITLSDGASSYEATGTCSVACTDTFCHSTQFCLAKTSDCTSCDTTGCRTCAVNTSFISTYCNKVCPSNCVECSSATVCTQCKSGYFLYGKDGEVTCICNFYLACTASCNACTPGPDCFLCAEVVVQDGDTCRVDSVGFQISFASPNIEFDFANPLSSALKTPYIQAKTSQRATIDTTNWSLNPCNAGSKSCAIETDNLSESQLPIEASFTFNQA